LSVDLVDLFSVCLIYVRTVNLVFQLAVQFHIALCHRMKYVFQFDRYREVRDVTEVAITEMDHLADDLRNVSAQHGVHVAKAVADVDGRYVHMAVMTTACGKMELVADKLKTVDNTLRNMLTEDSPPREAQ
jgi:hypothetical protein